VVFWKREAIIYGASRVDRKRGCGDGNVLWVAENYEGPEMSPKERESAKPDHFSTTNSCF
jgi:hypothetical protein